MIDLKTIQRSLKAAGHYDGKIDGLIGPKTIKALIAATGLPYPPLARTAYEQMILQELGFYTGEIDGLIGPQSLWALEQYQNHLRDITPLAKDVAHQPKVWPRQKDVEKFYGEVGLNQTMLQLPYAMRLAWNKDVTVTQFSIHEKVAESAERAFKEILKHYGLRDIQRLRLDLFGGCLNVRKMRGGSKYSMHSWGIAIDFDPAHNQLRWGADKASLARPDYNPFWAIWEAEGWISLGRERNYDWMHVQAARL